MLLVRVGRRTLNLEFLVMTEERDEPPGRLRVVMSTGAGFDLDGNEAELLRRETAEFTDRRPSPPSEGGSVGRSVDPKSGAVLPRPRQRKERA